MSLSKKNLYLITGIFAMSIICYLLAVKKTLELKSKLLVAQEQQQKYADVDIQLSKLSKKDQTINFELSKLQLDNTSLQNNLLRILNEQCEANQIKILSFNAPHIVQSSNSEIKTHRFTLEGTYTSILKVVHGLEKQGTFGRVSHLDFEKERDFRRKTTSLKASVFLETVR